MKRFLLQYARQAKIYVSQIAGDDKNKSPPSRAHLSTHLKLPSACVGHVVSGDTSIPDVICATSSAASHFHSLSRKDESVAETRDAVPEVRCQDGIKMLIL